MIKLPIIWRQNTKLKGKNSFYVVGENGWKKIVRPAGVKSFNVTLYENLTFSKATLDAEMQAAMKDLLGPEWSPIVRVRSREGQQVYMYMHDEGEMSD